MRVAAGKGMQVWARLFSDGKAGELVKVSLEEMRPAPDDGGPAFPSTRPFVEPPRTYPITEQGTVSFESHPVRPFSFHGAEATESFPGMSLRDYFAAQALPALISDAMIHNATTTDPFYKVEFDEIAAKAYVAADNMLKERSGS